MINKKLIHFNKRETFDTELKNGNIPDTSIVFIKDTQEIYTHGQIYNANTITIQGPSSLEKAVGFTTTITEEENAILQSSDNKIVWVKFGGGYSWSHYPFCAVQYDARSFPINYLPLSDECNFQLSISNNKTVTFVQYKDAYKTKLDGIAAGAEVNVQSDWNVTDTDSDAFIKNKPTSMPASDVPAWAKAATKPTYTKAEVGLGNVDNTSDANKPISTATQTALNNKVDKVAGKGLSTNDYTTAEKDKLAGIEAQANKYVLPTATQTGLGGIKLGNRLDAEGTKVIATSLNSSSSLSQYSNVRSLHLGWSTDNQPIYFVLGEYQDKSVEMPEQFLYGSFYVERGGIGQHSVKGQIDVTYGCVYFHRNVNYRAWGNWQDYEDFEYIIDGVYKVVIADTTYLAIKTKKVSSMQISFTGIYKTAPFIKSESQITSSEPITFYLEPNIKKRFEKEILEKVAAGQTMENIMSYGVEWDTTVADPHITRIGNMSLHKSLPIQSGMKGCIAKGNEIQYYLDEDNWRYKKGYKSIRGENYTENLLLGSDVVKETSEYCVGKYQLADRFLAQREPITLTIWGELAESATRFAAYNSGDLQVATGIIEKVADGVYRCQGTWVNNELTSNTSLWIFHMSRTDDTQTSRIDKIKLERGTNNNPVWTKAESETTDSILARLDGYDGTVKVHVPRFYYKSEVDSNKRRVRISTIQIDPTWHEQPELLVDAYRSTVLNTVPTDMGYLSTLPVNSAISVVNTNSYCRGGGNRSGNDTYLITDQFRTDLGKPRTTIPRATMRTYSRNAGSEMLSYEQYKNIFYWLYVIEYANFNSQEAYNATLTSEGYRQGGLGPGVTTINGNYWSYYNGYYPLTPCGYCNSIGNGTGIRNMILKTPTTSGGTPTQVYTFAVPRWRGFDNPFGDIWTNLDGVLVDTPLAGASDTSILPTCYIITDPEKYTDSLTGIEEKADRSYKQAHSEGYVKEWHIGDHADMVPQSVGGNTTQYKCDYYWVNYDDTPETLLVGGDAHYGAIAGLGYFYSYVGVSISWTDIGFRSVSSFFSSRPV